ncbi:NTP transferase domain-containing protein [Candidatus Peregrinibacteria bacterium]|nr:NTP transferase domain-containing protein [Candidatus Peregrinibacteria bacterium]
MQVILLAAGQSTRLDPIADKNLLEFAGKPLIEHRVAALKKANMRDVVVVGNKHNADALEKALKGYKNVLVIEQKKLEDGMAGGVLAGAEAVKHKNIMVLSANDVFGDDLFEKAVQAAKASEDGLIVGKRVNSYFPGGYLKVDKKNNVTDVIEKPGEGKEPSDMVNIVLHIYNDFPAFVKYLKTTTGKADGRYEKALDAYIKKGKAKLKALKYTGAWQPIKFPWDILKVMNLFLQNQEPRIDKKADVSKQAIIRGDVVIGPNAKIFENAIIHGPVYIGDGAVVANNALVRNSMVGKNCVIGFSTEVARSYLNHDVWTHSNYVGDSVVDSNVSFGSGAVIGNLRFDEANVQVNIKGKKEDSGTNKLGAFIGSGARLGINASTNPGVKIGQNCFIGGSMYVDKDVPDDKMVLLEQKVKITSNKKTVSMNDRGEMKQKLG